MEAILFRNEEIVFYNGTQSDFLKTNWHIFIETGKLFGDWVYSRCPDSIYSNNKSNLNTNKITQIHSIKDEFSKNRMEQLAKNYDIGNVNLLEFTESAIKDNLLNTVCMFDALLANTEPDFRDSESLQFTDFISTYDNSIGAIQEIINSLSIELSSDKDKYLKLVKKARFIEVSMQNNMNHILNCCSELFNKYSNNNNGVCSLRLQTLNAYFSTSSYYSKFQDFIEDLESVWKERDEFATLNIIVIVGTFLLANEFLVLHEVRDDLLQSVRFYRIVRILKGEESLVTSSILLQLCLFIEKFNTDHSKMLSVEDIVENDVYKNVQVSRIRNEQTLYSLEYENPISSTSGIFITIHDIRFATLNILRFIYGPKNYNADFRDACLMYDLAVRAGNQVRDFDNAKQNQNIMWSDLELIRYERGSLIQVKFHQKRKDAAINYKCQSNNLRLVRLKYIPHDRIYDNISNNGLMRDLIDLDAENPILSGKVKYSVDHMDTISEFLETSLTNSKSEFQSILKDSELINMAESRSLQSKKIYNIREGNSGNPYESSIINGLQKRVDEQHLNAVPRDYVKAISGANFYNRNDALVEPVSKSSVQCATSFFVGKPSQKPGIRIPNLKEFKHYHDIIRVGKKGVRRTFPYSGLLGDETVKYMGFSMAGVAVSLQGIAAKTSNTRDIRPSYLLEYDGICDIPNIRLQIEEIRNTKSSALKIFVLDTELTMAYWKSPLPSVFEEDEVSVYNEGTIGIDISKDRINLICNDFTLVHQNSISTRKLSKYEELPPNIIQIAYDDKVIVLRFENDMFIKRDLESLVTLKDFVLDMNEENLKESRKDTTLLRACVDKLSEISNACQGSYFNLATFDNLCTKKDIVDEPVGFSVLLDPKFRIFSGQDTYKGFIILRDCIDKISKLTYEFIESQAFISLRYVPQVCQDMPVKELIEHMSENNSQGLEIRQLYATPHSILTLSEFTGFIIQLLHKCRINEAVSEFDIGLLDKLSIRDEYENFSRNWIDVKDTSVLVGSDCYDVIAWALSNDDAMDLIFSVCDKVLSNYEIIVDYDPIFGAILRESKVSSIDILSKTVFLNIMDAGALMDLSREINWLDHGDLDTSEIVTKFRTLLYEYNKYDDTVIFIYDDNNVKVPTFEESLELREYTYGIIKECLLYLFLIKNPGYCFDWMYSDFDFVSSILDLVYKFVSVMFNDSDANTEISTLARASLMCIGLDTSINIIKDIGDEFAKTGLFQEITDSTVKYNTKNIQNNVYNGILLSDVDILVNDIRDSISSFENKMGVEMSDLFNSEDQKDDILGLDSKLSSNEEADSEVLDIRSLSESTVFDHTAMFDEIEVWSGEEEDEEPDGEANAFDNFEYTSEFYEDITASSDDDELFAELLEDSEFDLISIIKDRESRYSKEELTKFDLIDDGIEQILAEAQSMTDAVNRVVYNTSHELTNSAAHIRDNKYSLIVESINGAESFLPENISSDDTKSAITIDMPSTISMKLAVDNSEYEVYSWEDDEETTEDANSNSSEAAVKDKITIMDAYDILKTSNPLNIASSLSNAYIFQLFNFCTRTEADRRYLYLSSILRKIEKSQEDDIEKGFDFRYLKAINHKIEW